MLQAFLEVAKTGNMTFAAQKLGITQPALSMRIRSLESQVGRGLFHRKKTGMELNEFGKSFFSACKKLNREVEHIDGWINEQRGSTGGTMRITCVSGVMNCVIPGFLGQFKQIYPETKFVIEQNISVVSEELVLGGSYDIGIITGRCQKKSLKAKLLFKSNDLIMVCTPEYAKRREGELAAANLSPEEILWFVNPRSRGTRYVAKHLGIVHLENIGGIRLPDMETCKIYAMSSLGVAVLARMFVYDELKGGRLIEIPGFNMLVPIYMISRNDAYQPPLISKFKEKFIDYCEGMDIKLKKELDAAERRDVKKQEGI